MDTTPRASSTTSSEGLGRFGARCAVFFAPLLGLLGFTAATLHRAGELYTPDEAVEIQARSDVLYLPQFPNWNLFFPRYHHVAASAHRADVLVLGSSRVKTLRSRFFRAPERQFNAGIPATERVGAWRKFLAALPPGGLPRTLFLDIDPWWFREHAAVEPPRDFMRGYSALELFDFAWRRGFWWSAGELSSPTPRAEGFLGVQAQLEHSGLRRDGSLHLAKRQPDEPPEVIARNIRDGLRPFFPDPGPLSIPALTEMRTLLRYATQHGIHVIGYISGFKPSYFTPMQGEPRIRYFFEAGPALEKLFAEERHEFFDFLDAAAIGCTDAEFVEPMHESEACTVRTLAEMARRSATVASLVDVEALRAPESGR
jgi:hypothetical protein